MDGENGAARPTDIRVRKTCKSLRAAILRLIETVPLEQISVARLCKEAEVSRMAFYSHYSIPEDCFQEIFDEMVAEFDKRVRGEGMDIDRVMREYLLMVKENRPFFRVIYNKGYHHPWVQMLYDQYFKYWRDSYPEDCVTFPDIYVKFSTYGHFGLVSDWVEDGCDESVEIILKLHKRFTEISKEYVKGL